MRSICVVVVAVVATVLAGGCGGGEKEETRTVDTHPASAEAKPATSTQPSGNLEMTMDWYLDGNFAGVVMAKERGFFKDAGFEIDTFPPIIPVRPLIYLAAGNIDLTISPAPQMVEAWENGAPFVAIGTLLKKPTTSMIWLPSSGMEDVADLAGKTVGTAGLPYEEDFIEAIATHAGVPPGEVEVKRVGYNLTGALAKGHVDAILGSPNIEGVTLSSRGLHPTVVPLRNLGVPPFDEEVVVARRDKLQSEPLLFRGFFKALVHGTAAARESPHAAALAVQRNTSANSRTVGDQVKPTLPLLSATARLDPRRWRRMVAWMHANHLIQKQPQMSELLTNAYLP
jgi:putative hydroxymethylpyrimidine transport system substrate-binding protein